MKILLDAGHGYSTPGKRSPDGMQEYDFNRRVAAVMKGALEQYEGVTVYFAHDDKRDVPLKERTDLANRLGVDLFVSIHANANTGKMGAWGGIDTFIYLTNQAESRKVAEVIQRNLIEATGLRNRGVKTADFHVLRETAKDGIPAVLIEHGFMDSTTDLPFLKSDDYRVLCGETNVKSIAEAYGLKRKKEAVKVANETPKQVVSPFAKEAAEWVKAMGISDGSRPQDPITRQEVWTMLHRLYTKMEAK